MKKWLRSSRVNFDFTRVAVFYENFEHVGFLRLTGHQIASDALQLSYVDCSVADTPPLRHSFVVLMDWMQIDDTVRRAAHYVDGMEHLDEWEALSVGTPPAPLNMELAQPTPDGVYPQKHSFLMPCKLRIQDGKVVEIIPNLDDLIECRRRVDIRPDGYFAVSFPERDKIWHDYDKTARSDSFPRQAMRDGPAQLTDVRIKR